jgi:hypothetical protein
MITGDDARTATAIARRVGMLDEAGEVLTRAELGRLDEETWPSGWPASARTPAPAQSRSSSWATPLRSGRSARASSPWAPGPTRSCWPRSQGAVAVQLAILYLPALPRLFDTQPLSPIQLALVLAASTAAFVAVELGKGTIRRRARRSRRIPA